MEFKFCLPLALGFLFPVSPAFASPVRIIYSSQAQGVNSPLIQLKLGLGSGMNISLPKGEIIKKAWLDDMSRIGLSSDGNLCQWTAQQQQECKDEDASMLHMRQIKWIGFRNTTYSPDGSTLLTVRAQGVEGQKTYLFKIVPTGGLSEFSNLDILSDSEKPPRLLSNTSPRPLTQPSSPDISPDQPNSPNPVSNPSVLPLHPLNKDAELQSSTPDHNNVAPSDLTPSALSLRQSIDQATTLAFGLLAAIQSREIQPNNTIWNQAQDTISRLRQGESLSVAMSSSGLKPLALNYLLALGTQENDATKLNNQENATNKASDISSSLTSSDTTSLVSPQLNTVIVDSSTTRSSATLSPGQSAHTQTNLNNDAKATALGLFLAKQKGEIEPHSSQWKQIQKVIVKLRQGISVKTALLDTDLEHAEFNRLLVSGQNRLMSFN